MAAAFFCLDPAIVPAGSRQSVAPMSYHRFAEIAVALCFGLTLALVDWWEIAGPIWREEWTGSAEQWLDVASAALVGCATLVGAAGALSGVLRTGE
jgi:hypothetical protein